MTNNKIRLRNITILLGSTMTVLAGAILSPALPGMAMSFQELPNSEYLVRLALTMPALFIAIGAPFAGILLDKWGRKLVIILSLLLYGIAGVSGYFANTLSAVLIGRAFLGLATAGLMSGFTTLIGDYFSGKRLNQFMGYQGAFIGLGGMVFLLLGGYLADIDWRLVFLVYLFAFIVLPAAVFSINEPQTQTKEKANKLQEINDDLPIKTILLIFGIAGLGMLIFFAIPVFLPFYLTAQGGANGSLVGLVLSLQTVSSIITALLYQKLKERLSFIGIFSLVFLTLGLNYLIIANTSSNGFLIIGMLIGGLGLGMLPPNINVWIVTITPSVLRGRVLGGLTTALFLGQFLSPIIFQPLVNKVGIAYTFSIIGYGAIIITIIFSLVSLRKPNNTPQEKK